MKDQSWLDKIAEMKRQSVHDIMQSLNESFRNKTIVMLTERKYTDTISFPSGLTREKRMEHIRKELEIYDQRMIKD